MDNTSSDMHKKKTTVKFASSRLYSSQHLLLESRIVTAGGPGSVILVSLEDSVTKKNSPDSSMLSCTMLIVAQSVVPEVRVNVKDSVTGV